MVDWITRQLREWSAAWGYYIKLSYAFQRIFTDCLMKIFLFSNLYYLLNLHQMSKWTFEFRRRNANLYPTLLLLLLNSPFLAVHSSVVNGSQKEYRERRRSKGRAKEERTYLPPTSKGLLSFFPAAKLLLFSEICNTFPTAHNIISHNLWFVLRRMRWMQFQSCIEFTLYLLPLPKHEKVKGKEVKYKKSESANATISY